MPPDEDDYTNFETVQSGSAPGTIEGLLPLDGPAEAFRYRKELFIHVDLSRFTNTASLILIGKWKIRLRDALDGNILFEQEVEWRAGITAFVDPLFGIIGLVTWSPIPSGPGLPPGGGKFTTTIVNGETINPADAWKHVDTSQPTIFSEQGYTIFSPEGVATVGTYEFFATFYSPAYVCDLPEGAVLERVFDQWGIGTIDDNATFAFSFRGGQRILDAAHDTHGGLLQATSSKFGAFASLGYGPYEALGKRGFVQGAKHASINEDPQGRVWMLVKEKTGWFEHVSYSGARSFIPHVAVEGEEPRPVWPKEVQMARAMIDDDGSRATAALVGKDVYFKLFGEEGDLTAFVMTLERRQDVAPVKRDGKWQIVGEEGVLAVSVDGGANWTERPALAELTADDLVNENGLLIGG